MKVRNVPISPKTGTYCRMMVIIYFYEKFIDSFGEEKHHRKARFAEFYENLPDQELENHLRFKVMQQYINGKYQIEAEEKEWSQTFMNAIIYQGYPTMADERQHQRFKYTAKEAIGDMISELERSDIERLVKLEDMVKECGKKYRETYRLNFDEVQYLKMLFPQFGVPLVNRTIDNAVNGNLSESELLLSKLRTLWTDIRTDRSKATLKINQIREYYEKHYSFSNESFLYLQDRFAANNLYFNSKLFAKAKFELPQEC
jgi:hypothetical protein